jgi:hypothetical protein
MRNNSLRAVVAFSALFCLSCFAVVRASAMLEGKGSVSGTVTAEDGKPLVGLALRLEQDIPMGMGPAGGRGKGKSSSGDSGASELQGKPNPRIKIFGRTVTDQSGRFSFTNIDEGVYRLVAGSKSQGWIFQDVEVKANEDTKLEGLKLVKVK